MEASIDYHLRKVVRGTVAALLGSILGLFLVFLSRVLMARYLSVREYGIFSLCYVIVTLLTVLSLVGLDAGTSRQIAFSRRENGAGKIGGIIRSSLLIATTSSVVAGFLLFVLSDYISVAFFQTKELAVPLKIVSIGLPFLTLLLLFVSIYRGFDRADMKVYFSDLAKNGLFVL
ncbi:MAG: oligosaccharide flippase family protein, partial [Thermoplasmata archaeon]